MGNVLTAGRVSATGNVYGNSFIVLGGGSGISASGNIIGGNILTAGIVSATGNITGNYILGNGALLTGISAGSGNTISNGTSNVVVTANSNVTIAVAGNNVATFASTGIYNPGIISAAGNIFGNAFISTGAGAGSISGTGNITGGNLFSTGVISTAGNIFGGNIILSGISRDRLYTVATLPPAATANIGARAFVTDSNTTTFYANIGAGGTNAIPVFSDGVSWRAG
jgi:hypothetical protein